MKKEKRRALRGGGVKGRNKKKKIRRFDLNVKISSHSYYGTNKANVRGKFSVGGD